MKGKLPHSFHLLPFNANLLMQYNPFRKVMQSYFRGGKRIFAQKLAGLIDRALN